MNQHGRLKNKTALLQFLALLFILLLAAACSQTRSGKAPFFPSADFSLTVLHTNDTHSTYGGTTAEGLICYAAMCEGGRGGYVRLEQAVRAIRKDSPDALLLDAGDKFQGSLFWTLHKERMPMALIDRVGYSAIIPGNHEFDDGSVPFLNLARTLQTPVLAANLSFTPPREGMESLRPWLVFERGGRKIGVVGITNPDTPKLASPCSAAHFADAAESLRTAVEELEAQGVNIIIALTHIGLENDRRLARAVDGVDIIVGAHSHSLLSNTHERADGPYPIMEKTPDGTPVLVVSAYTATTYLGKLDVGFDDKGVVKEWRGDPILMDQATLNSMGAPKPDAGLVNLLDDFAVPVAQMMKTRIGTISAEGKAGMALEEPNVLECRRVECLTGNVVTDAMRTVPFPEAQIAIINGGALRNSLPGGTVTPGNVLGTMPFQNKALTAKVPGAVLLQALERSVATYGEGEGCFLQVSGLRYSFKPANNQGKRITKAEVLDKSGQWRPLNPKTAYQVVTVDFVARGGDGFAMLKPMQWEEGDKLMNDVLRIYLERHSPVEASLQGRITVQR